MNVRFNLIQQLAKLENKKQRRYNNAEIGRKAGLSRQTVRNVMGNAPTQINVDTLGGLLAFFADEGMPVTINDLFTVTDDAP